MLGSTSIRTSSRISHNGIYLLSTVMHPLPVHLLATLHLLVHHQERPRVLQAIVPLILRLRLAVVHRLWPIKKRIPTAGTEMDQVC